MSELWKINENFKGYSSKRTSIADTFTKRQKHVGYKRNYTRLDQEQLLELLKVAKENCWTALDLSNCGLDKLPDELWEIESLKLLYLGNQEEIAKDVNTFTEISEKIQNLCNLEALSIRNLKSLKLPNSLKHLPNLVYLDCFGCDFKKIPLNLINKNIKSIGIDCKNVEQVASLCKMKNIEEMYLSGSPIKKLPVEIANLKSLRILTLANTKIEIIPESLLSLKKLKILVLFNTPLEGSLPEEMRRQTAKELISYICKQQKEQGKYYFNESKMLILGQGNVGKSCVLERITKNNYEEKKSTEGIDVKKWAYNKNRKQYTLNIWDFGGQEIYHSTHQFFLTKRSLYVLVWDARAEEEYGRIDYWLKTIESFADDSPIIVCINKCDKETTRINRIDFKEYKDKYPQIKAVIDISCKDNINISALKTIIKEQASNLQITKEKWIKSWYDVRTEIEVLRNEYKYISYEKYMELCEKHGVDSEEAKSLSKYLHDLGIILHYQDDLYLRSIVILSPEWATAAVYKILDSQETVLKKRNGVLKLTDLPMIWDNKSIYPEDKYIFLLKIMEKFQLCFQLNKESYLVAELLENSYINCPSGWDFNNDFCVSIIYKYDFIPAGVMTRFIVQIHDYIAKQNGNDLCWKKGVYLKHKSAYAQVVMKDSLSEKKIEIKVNKQGESIHQRELLFIIRKTLNEINSKFKKLQVQEYVPCNCKSNCPYQFPYKSLCNALDNNVETLQCYESFQHVKILKLLEGIDIMSQENNSPYSISITNSPNITTTTIVDAHTVQKTTINITEIKNKVMELQGDVSEIKNEILESIKGECDEEIKVELDKINADLENVGNLESSEEIIKSGKLNKLKRWLSNFSDEKSEIRKALSGAKSVFKMVSSLIIKFNWLAEKLGIDIIPPIS